MSNGVSKVLKEFIEMAGSSERSLAVRIGAAYPITRATVGHWRRGVANPKLDRLAFIFRRVRHSDPTLAALLIEMMRALVAEQNGRSNA